MIQENDALRSEVVDLRRAVFGHGADGHAAVHMTVHNDAMPPNGTAQSQIDAWHAALAQSGGDYPGTYADGEDGEGDDDGAEYGDEEEQYYHTSLAASDGDTDDGYEAAKEGYDTARQEHEYPEEGLRPEAVPRLPVAGVLGYEEEEYEEDEEPQLLQKGALLLRAREAD